MKTKKEYRSPHFMPLGYNLSWVLKLHRMEPGTVVETMKGGAYKKRSGPGWHNVNMLVFTSRDVAMRFPMLDDACKGEKS